MAVERNYGAADACRRACCVEVLDWNRQWGGGGRWEEEEVDATLVKETIKVTIR